MKKTNGIINKVVEATEHFKKLSDEQNLPDKVIQKIYSEFNFLL